MATMRRDVDVDTTVTQREVVAPQRTLDLVRWGPVIAGIFAALATLVTLTILGIAIGSATYEAGDNLGDIGLGAGIWGAISVLISFFVGGLLAARTAATPERVRLRLS